MAVVHPIVARPQRLVAYLAVALAFGALLALLLERAAPGGGLAANAAFALPMALFYAFQCLTVWYPVRTLASDMAAAPRLVLVLTVASFVAAAIWLAVGLAWSRALELAGLAGAGERFRISAPLVFSIGVFLFALAALLHALFAAVERSRAAERRALELQVHAREAELKALKAQLDPHFLFNSLNSVAALISTDPKAARRMCFLMAGFFRKSLGLGARESIPLGEEMYLAETFLAIEEVRFGPRLRPAIDVAEETLALSVPPLLLQPLVENAVHHGIAHLLEGGEVRISARRRGGELELAVENPCDPERPASRGAGVGLANVRARLDASFGPGARLEVDAAPERHRVRILLPATPAAS
jgi:two-component system, LytTR family, sensor histidine kinase AlgZ